MRASADRFFEVSSSPMCIIDKPGNLLRANPACLHLFNLPQLTGTQQFVELIHPDDQDLARERIASLSPDTPHLRLKTRTCDLDGPGGRISWSLQFDPETQLIYATGFQRSPGEASSVAEVLPAQVEPVSFFEQMLYNVDDHVFAWNLQNQFIYINRSLEELWGLSREQVLGKTPADIGYPADLQELFARQIQEVFATRRPVLHEVGYTSPRGVFGYYEYALSPVLDDDGNVVFVGGVSRDTTRRRQAEDALRESEERLRLATEAANMFSWEIDLADFTFSWSQNATAVVNLPMPTSLDEALAMVHPEDVVRVEGAIRGAIQEQGEFQVEYRIADAPRRDNRWRYLTGITVDGHDGLPTRMLGVTQDITDRKRRELNAEFLANVAGDFARLTSSDDILRATGERIKSHFGVSRLTISNVSEATDEVQVIYDRHDPGLADIAGTHRLSEYLSGAFLDEVKSGSVIAIEDSYTDPRTAGNAEMLESLGMRSHLLVGYGDDESLAFLIAMQHAEPHEWRADQIELLQELRSRLYLRLERARVELALRGSEDRYRTLFESIDQGYLLCDVIFDANGQPEDIFYVEANPSAIRMIGTDPTGRRLTEIDPNFESYWFEIWGHVARTGEAQRMERYAEPLQIWISFYIFKPAADNPDSRRVVVVFQDVTERRQAELALRESEARQSFLLSLADRLRGLSEPREIMTAASVALGQHLGVSQLGYCEIEDDQDTAIAGGEYSDGRMPSFAGHRFRISDYGPGYGPAMRAGEAVFYADINVDPRAVPGGSDEMRAMRVRAGAGVPLVKQGRLVAFLYALAPEPREWSENERLLLHEVAERTWAAAERARAEEALRESEARFRESVEVATVGVIFFDLEGQITDANDAFLAMGGYSREDLEAGRLSWDKLTPPEWMPASRNAAAEMESVGYSTPYEKEYYRKDGSRWWALFAAKSLGHHGNIEYIIDLTERKQAEDERERLLAEAERERRKAEDAVRARDVFLSIASHELRNPLATIRASAQLLSRSFEQGRLDEERGQRLTSALVESSGRLATLVDDLLDVSRLQSGRMTMNLEAVNLAHLVHEIVSDHNMASTGHRFRVDLEDNHVLPLDAERIRQVLVNLLNNATKYSPDSSEVDVILRYDEEGALLRVRDYGIGLPEGTAEDIFRPFGRAPNAAASNIPGMGLGLYICRRIAEAHGGRLWAESEGEGRGTTMYLRLPTGDEDDREGAATSTGGG